MGWALRGLADMADRETAEHWKSLAIHPWRCGARSDKELLALFEHGGSRFFRDSAVARTGKQLEPGVLVLNLGIRYDLRCFSERNCSFSDPVPALLDALQRGNKRAFEIELNPKESKLQLLKDFNSRREAICSLRNNVTGTEPPERAYAKDLIRLALFVERYRTRLPALVVWLDTTPQHFRGSGTYPLTSKQQDISKWKKVHMSGPLCQAFEAGAQATWRN